MANLPSAAIHLQLIHTNPEPSKSPSSLFENLVDDMEAAADLQVLITMRGYKYILERKVSHRSIPDDPTVESQRRQFFFGSAIGIPIFYVHKTGEVSLESSAGIGEGGGLLYHRR